ncbi:MAG TPA: hypothetical protein VNT60_00975, partial [Deinococcales bacterium]|nr:hypothetical protein [Deinococcales bacterium]
PMLLMGDEVARTQHGNNNTYCHDNELSWFDWTATEQQGEQLRFFQNLIAFRHAHPVLRNRWHLSERDYVGSGYPDLSWHGTTAWHPDFSPGSHRLAFMLDGNHARGGTERDDFVYVALNAHWDGAGFQLPVLPQGHAWHVAANTGMRCPHDIYAPGQEVLLEDQGHILVGPRSSVILVGKKPA